MDSIFARPVYSFEHEFHVSTWGIDLKLATLGDNLRIETNEPCKYCVGTSSSALPR